MSTISERASSTFRNYQVSGVPGSGDHEPIKADIRALFAAIDAALSGVTASGGATVFKATRALLDADLAHAANVIALVYADSTAANNDFYLKAGSSGSGSWTKLGITIPATLAADIAAFNAAYGSIEAALDETLAAKTAAEVARDAAVGAIESAGVVKFYDTKSAATSDLPSLSNGDVICVFADEDNGSYRTYYKVVAGALVLKLIDADQRVKRVSAFKTAGNTWAQALTNCCASAGQGGVVVVDAAVNLAASWSGGSGQILSFEGGTISPHSSGTFAWNGDIRAPMVQIFTGANLNKVRVTTQCQAVYHEWWGAYGDGTNDDYAAIEATYAARQSGGLVKLLAKTYAHGTKIVWGNGTTTMRSTIHNGLVIEGVAAGVGDGEFSAPNVLTSYKWIGATGSSVVQTEIAGGIHSLRIRSVILDANAKAGTCGLWIHLYRCLIEDVYALNWAADGWAWDFQVRDSAAYKFVSGVGFAAGVTQGFMENIFRHWGARNPPNATAHCVKMYAGANNNIGFSRNLFEQVQLVRGTGVTSISLRILGMDNNTFTNIFCIGSGTPYQGYALQRLTSPSFPTFPTENIFNSTRFVGYITTQDKDTFADSTIGGSDLIIGFAAIDDGAVEELPYGMRAITTDGTMMGAFSGAQMVMHGSTASQLAATGIQYLPLSPFASPQSSSVTGFRATHDGYIDMLSSYLNTAPGGSTSRSIIVQVNGVDKLLNAYGSGQNGQKEAKGPIAFATNDLIEIVSYTPGTAAASHAQYSLAMRYKGVIGQ